MPGGHRRASDMRVMELPGPCVPAVSPAAAGGNIPVALGCIPLSGPAPGSGVALSKDRSSLGTRGCPLPMETGFCAWADHSFPPQ